MLRRLLLVLPVLLAACGGGGDGAGGAATTAPPARAITATVDWEARTIELDGQSRFDVRFCDGEAPFLCVSEGDDHIGVIELASFDGEIADFDAWAAELYDSIAADRSAHCDPTYVLEGDGPAAAPFAGRDGVRYGFVGSTDGTPVERVLGYAANGDGSLHLLVANALADDACLSRESELPLDAMDDLAPVLEAIAAGSRI